MNRIEVKPGQRWRYLGREPGHGRPHTITGIFRAAGHPPEITTWSDPNEAGELGGMAWQGPFSNFLEQFQPMRV